MDPRPSKQEFRAALSGQELKGIQLLHAALPTGIFLFFVVVLILAWIRRGGDAVDPESAETALILSGVHAVMAVSLWALAPRLHALRLARSAGLATGGGSEQAAAAVTAIRGAGILRLALLEGPALLGLVTCIIAASAGVLREQPLYWLNALSALLFIAFAVVNFPTRDRVEAIFDRHFTR